MVIILSLFILVIFGLMLRNVFDKRKRLKRVDKKGVEAKAVLLNINYTGTNIKTPQPVRLQIKVYPEAGNYFVTEVADVLYKPAANKYSIGDSFIVKYNPANLEEMVIIT